MADPQTVRLMTWNIHGIGRNSRFTLAGVVALIQRWQPDVVALQEVDSRRKLAGGENPFTVLLAALGKHGIGVTSIATADGEYGQMLISNHPILTEAVHDISWPEREPRRAVVAEIAAPAGRIRVVAAHLGLAIHERRGQARVLLDIAGNADVPTVVIGDFNDWFWAGSVRKVLSQEFPSRTRYRTFPAICPVLRLDRIYCRPPAMLKRSFVDRQARHISDHLPVIGDVVLRTVAIGAEDEPSLPGANP